MAVEHIANRAAATAGAGPTSAEPARATAGVPRAGGNRIGLWGSPSSGKTTFLAALRLAAYDADDRHGRWQVIASDDRSERFLVESSRTLAVDRTFPEATQRSVQLGWRFRGDLTGTPYAPRRRWRGGTRGDAAVDFELSLLDVPGMVYRDLSQDAGAEESIEHLATSSGLLYLFDPTTEAEKNESFAYLNGTLTRLARRCADRLEGPYLPHHISVCMTKFDDPEVFERARRGGWAHAGPEGTPVVTDASGFFDWLARDLHGSTMDLIGRALRNSFHPARIRFFATSAIGFGTTAGGEVDLRRFGNVDDEDGARRIIGPVRPYNVMEPVIALMNGLREGRR
ncbi:hypothetical protein [Streptomyces longwoodensis]|uniref:hypothetical protein n=1 Tax=Streptomyces longwoodensis TaxID=68231 RepID=UPI0033E92AE4